MEKRLTVSSKGLEDMKKRLESSQDELIALRKYKGAEAVDNGDVWHDNNDFEQCEIQERALQKDINDLEHQIATAIVVDTEKDYSIVDFGARVTVQLTYGVDDFETDTFLFSDSDESSALTKISANSPLGEEIYKKEVGYDGSYKVRSNTIKVKILKIEY